MSFKEVGRVLDYPIENMTDLTEDKLIPKTKVERIPDKIKYSTLFSVTSLSSSMLLIDLSYF